MKTTESFMCPGAPEPCSVTILVLYSTSLLNSLVNSSSFIVYIIKSSPLMILPYTNKDNFTSSLLNWIAFLLLIALAEPFSPMMNFSCESGHPFLIPYLES